MAAPLDADPCMDPVAPAESPRAVTDHGAAAVVVAVPSAEGLPPVEPWVLRGGRWLLGEPSLLVAVAYLFVSFIGLWANFWFYRAFGLPIMEYMQASDYLVAGLHDPMYALVLACSVALMLLVTWPERYRARHPQRVSEMRTHWWGRQLFPERRWLSWRGFGIAPVSGLVFGVFWCMVWACTAYVSGKALTILRGGGVPVQVVLAGEDAPQPGSARLLGTTNAYVLLWWPATRQAEAIPVSAVKRLTSLPRRAAAPAAGTKAAR